MEEIPASALEELAIFPLPDLVLFPGALQALHIFEPRYRDMMAYVLDGSRLLAVARLMPGYEDEYDGRPAVYSVAGIGRCIAADRLPDGRYNIMLRGLARMHIENEHPAARSYRRVRARILGDDRSLRPGDEIRDLHHELLAMVERLADVVPDGELLRQHSQVVADPGGCADVVAAALVRDPDVRQLLLENLDPAERLEVVIEHVTMLIGQFGPGNRTVN
jgi:Lon protease-like protein